MKAQKKVLAGLVAIGLVAVFAASSSFAGASDRGHTAAASSTGASLTRPFVFLGRGTQGRSLDWKISAYGREGRLPLAPHDLQRPCLEVETEETEGDATSLTGSAACYSGVEPPGYLTATSEPLIVVGRAPFGKKATALSAIGMAFAPVATKLEATFADGSTQTIPLRQLKPKQARKIGRMRFSYTAFAVKGLWCPTRLVSLNAAGQPLWEEQEQGCFLHGAEEGPGVE